MKKFKEFLEEAKRVFTHKQAVGEDEFTYTVSLKDDSDKSLDGFADDLLKWARKNKIVHIEDTKVNEPYDIDNPMGVKNKANVDINKKYAKKFEEWLKSGESKFVKG